MIYKYVKLVTRKNIERKGVKKVKKIILAIILVAIFSFSAEVNAVEVFTTESLVYSTINFRRDLEAILKRHNAKAENMGKVFFPSCKENPNISTYVKLETVDNLSTIKISSYVTCI